MRTIEQFQTTAEQLPTTMANPHASIAIKLEHSTLVLPLILEQESQFLRGK
jgi:hypothetical protein